MSPDGPVAVTVRLRATVVKQCRGIWMIRLVLTTAGRYVDQWTIRDFLNRRSAREFAARLSRSFQ